MILSTGSDARPAGRQNLPACDACIRYDLHSLARRSLSEGVHRIRRHDGASVLFHDNSQETAVRVIAGLPGSPAHVSDGFVHPHCPGRAAVLMPLTHIPAVAADFLPCLIDPAKNIVLIAQEHAVNRSAQVVIEMPEDVLKAMPFTAARTVDQSGGRHVTAIVVLSEPSWKTCVRKLRKFDSDFRGPRPVRSGGCFLRTANPFGHCRRFGSSRQKAVSPVGNLSSPGGQQNHQKNRGGPRVRSKLSAAVFCAHPSHPRLRERGFVMRVRPGGRISPEFVDSVCVFGNVRWKVRFCQHCFGTVGTRRSGRPGSSEGTGGGD